MFSYILHLLDLGPPPTSIPFEHIIPNPINISSHTIFYTIYLVVLWKIPAFDSMNKGSLLCYRSKAAHHMAKVSQKRRDECVQDVHNRPF